jgi:uncharacterized protein GlcG (DUF336 family)
MDFLREILLPCAADGPKPLIESRGGIASGPEKSGRSNMAKTITKTSISGETAKLLIGAAEVAAKEIGVPMVIAIVDESGVLKAFSRMDGAAQLSVDIAQDKAYTAISFGIATHEWFEFVKNDPPLLHGIIKTPRLVVFGGGYPIKIDGAVVGGIGVSGGHYEQDMKVAQAALAALG